MPVKADAATFFFENLSPILDVYPGTVVLAVVFTAGGTADEDEEEEVVRDRPPPVRLTDDLDNATDAVVVLVLAVLDVPLTSTDEVDEEAVFEVEVGLPSIRLPVPANGVNLGCADDSSLASLRAF